MAIAGVSNEELASMELAIVKAIRFRLEAFFFNSSILSVAQAIPCSGSFDVGGRNTYNFKASIYQWP